MVRQIRLTFHHQTFLLYRTLSFNSFNTISVDTYRESKLSELLEPNDLNAERVLVILSDAVCTPSLKFAHSFYFLHSNHLLVEMDDHCS